MLVEGGRLALCDGRRLVLYVGGRLGVRRRIGGKWEVVFKNSWEMRGLNHYHTRQYCETLYITIQA